MGDETRASQQTQNVDLFEESQNELKQQAWARLVPITQHKGATTYELYQDSTSFGRAAPMVDIIIQDPGISGKHCTIRKESIGHKSNDYVVWLEDHSTNGTFINHEIIGKGSKRLLQNGATVDLLFRGKGKDSNISFIFQDCRKEEAEQHEEGGPHQFFHLMQILGTGTFAKVRLAIEKDTGDHYAIKIIDKKKFLMSNATKRKNPLMDEVKILSQLSHPNIIGIKRVFETETTLYLVLELVTGGELLDKILEEKHFPEEKARNYFRQMLEAECYLHAQDIAHRDLKPENILLKDPDSDIIKLSDFGLSRVVDQASFMKTICGTPQYVAPEILTSNRNEGYGLACDLWSSGVILYIMLVGYPPFSDTKPKPVFEQIKTGDYDFPKDYWSGISPSAIYLIKRLLTVDPRKRITAKEALESAWMKGLTHDENEKNF
jgi:serine/threonine-protein kinase Chk2